MMVRCNVLISHSKPKSATKAQPKPAAGGADNANGAAKTAGQGRAGRGRKRGGKPKPKSAEELDAEMMDYFAPDAGNGASADASGAAAPAAATQPVAAAGGDGMVEDEIMVCTSMFRFDSRSEADLYSSNSA